MEAPQKALAVTLAVVGLGLAIAVLVLLRGRSESEASWEPTVEGFLAVPTPCCTEATLWNDLDEVTSEGQRARPATTAEAARWIDTWPYRERPQDEPGEGAPLSVSLQSREVRCVGAATGPEVPRDGDDEATLRALRLRKECVYARWKVWSQETAEQRPNERHTVWVDDNGSFRGRVDYWE